MSAPFSRAAAESWADIHWAVDAGLMEPPPLVWGCPNNPFVIDVNHPPHQPRTKAGMGNLNASQGRSSCQTGFPRAEAFRSSLARTLALPAGPRSSNSHTAPRSGAER